MRSLLVFLHPVFWLLAASALTAVYVSRDGGFEPVRRPDTNSYEILSIPKHIPHDADIADKKVLLALGSTRTLGYPLFLGTVGQFTSSERPIPWIHWVLYTSALVCFWYAVYVFSGLRWFGFAVALPLAYPCAISYFAWVMPDALAAVFSLVAIASVLTLVRRPSSRLAWVGLTGATFLAYQVKPVTQYLVVLLPVLALLLRLSIEPLDLRSSRRWLLRVTAATALPLLLFCTVRLAVVGQFSLVSFNGYNLIGIAANLIDEDVVASMPDKHRPMAERILRAREVNGRKPYSQRPSMRRWRRDYVSDQWKICESVARHVILEEIADGRAPGAELLPISLVIERRLAALSSTVLRMRPRAYAKWVASSFFYGIERFLGCATIRWLLVLLLGSLPLALGARIVRSRADVRRVSDEEAGGPRYWRALSGILLVSTTFYLACIGLISVVSWPMPRYLFLANLLLPSALGGAVYVLWATALRSPRVP